MMFPIRKIIKVVYSAIHFFSKISIKKVVKEKAMKTHKRAFMNAAFVISICTFLKIQTALLGREMIAWLSLNLAKIHAFLSSCDITMHSG